MIRREDRSRLTSFWKDRRNPNDICDGNHLPSLITHLLTPTSTLPQNPRGRRIMDIHIFPPHYPPPPVN